MKKSLFLPMILICLLVSACGFHTSSPEQIAKYCQDVNVFMLSVANFAQLGLETSEAEYNAAYRDAVSNGNQLHWGSEDMHEDEVWDFNQAALDMAASLDYAIEILPTAANYLKVITEVQTQYGELLIAYQDLQTSLCAP